MIISQAAQKVGARFEYGTCVHRKTPIHSLAQARGCFISGKDACFAPSYHRDPALDYILITQSLSVGAMDCSTTKAARCDGLLV